jgi:N-acetylglutamate synthase-like GNAT family acetyltransferase
MNHEYIAYHPKKAEGMMDVAETIASWTIGEHMLPKTTKDIATLFDQGLSVVVFDREHPVGHAGITAQYPDTKQIEIGTIVTHPDMRGKHVGTAATVAVLQLGQQEFPGWTPMAMANVQSATLFEKYGGVVMDTKLLSPTVFEFCITCPKRPPQPADGSPKCCDTPYDLSPILTSFGIAWMSLFVWGGTYEKPY